MSWAPGAGPGLVDVLGRGTATSVLGALLGGLGDLAEPCHEVWRDHELADGAAREAELVARAVDFAHQDVVRQGAYRAVDAFRGEGRRASHVAARDLRRGGDGGGPRIGHLERCDGEPGEVKMNAEGLENHECRAP